MFNAKGIPNSSNNTYFKPADALLHLHPWGSEKYCCLEVCPSFPASILNPDLALQGLQLLTRQEGKCSAGAQLMKGHRSACKRLTRHFHPSATWRRAAEMRVQVTLISLVYLPRIKWWCSHNQETVCTTRKGSDTPSAAAHLWKWWLGGIWSRIDLVLSRKTGEQQGFSRMCTRMNYHCESCDGRLATPCSQLETEKVLRKNFEIQPELKRES